MNGFDLNKIDWDKGNGLIPAIIQENKSHTVLMLGYMNLEALQLTLQTKKVTFFSRTKNRIWQKGETSGHYLNLKTIYLDCDQDSLLILVEPESVTCHQGNFSCFNITASLNLIFLNQLFFYLKERRLHPQLNSYTSKLFQEGCKRIAQKVGEEGVETALAAVAGTKEELLEESADLLFHLLLLLVEKEIQLEEVIEILHQRHKSFYPQSNSGAKINE